MSRVQERKKSSLKGSKPMTSTTKVINPEPTQHLEDGIKSSASTSSSYQGWILDLEGLVDPFHSPITSSTEVFESGTHLDGTSNSIWDSWQPTMESNANLEQSISPRSRIPSGLNLSMFPEVKQNQIIKRKEQNKISQRAYRNRKAEYVHSLETEIDEMDKSILGLQSENAMLLRRLCNLHIENNTLRSRGHDEPKRKQDSPTMETASSTPSPVPAKAVCHSLSTSELEALYEPFVAIWNLVRSRLGPSHREKDLSTVFERLQDMATQRLSEPPTKS